MKMSLQHQRSDTDRGKIEDGEKSVAVSLRLPQIPYGLTRDRTRASAVTGLQVTGLAMALVSSRKVIRIIFIKLQFLRQMKDAAAQLG